MQCMQSTARVGTGPKAVRKKSRPCLRTETTHALILGYVALKACVAHALGYVALYMCAKPSVCLCVVANNAKLHPCYCLRPVQQP